MLICHLNPDAAIIVYEYAITFAQEVAVVWQRKFSFVSLLLIYTRWTLLLEALFLMLPQPTPEVRVASIHRYMPSTHASASVAEVRGFLVFLYDLCLNVNP
jgi:hypothetical protein